MDGVKCFKHTCVGESHLATGKPCQDFSLAESKKEFAVAIVSDGHGGSRYFRSDVGSKKAVRCAKKAIEKFVKDTDIRDLFSNSRLKTFGIESDVKNKDDQHYRALSWLTYSIIAQWHKEIQKHALETPLSEWELSHIDKQYIEEFKVKLQDETATFEKTYGCTLMAYVQTETFWFAFQIGDGKMVFFNRDERGIEVCQPIPWDERCFLNKTTSICDSDASKEFRYCCCGDEKFPEVVFLGSDGIDDTYGDGDRLTDFYIRLYKEVVSTSLNKAKKVLESDLPQISKIGSKDDMSIACVYNGNPRRQIQNVLLMSQWQLAKLHKESEELDDKRRSLREKIERLKDSGEQSESQRIELKYAENDLIRVEEALEKNERNVHTIQTFDRNLNKRK